MYYICTKTVFCFLISCSTNMNHSGVTQPKPPHKQKNHRKQTSLFTWHESSFEIYFFQSAFVCQFEKKNVSLGKRVQWRQTGACQEDATILRDLINGLSWSFDSIAVGLDFDSSLCKDVQLLTFIELKDPIQMHWHRQSARTADTRRSLRRLL